ncbi:hypothetical protein L227DRAFT_343624 [Lentinus tigrinus ALCF2SS1-6]|uniref:Fungal-type protein kinase domain-containing protein n=2 Tax=Lentinus tigrinus TaxID=5365 RepID=A0A5C2RSM8_9APHY|nr:hypothetical protein L227DRAFT_343624 [Lentinus tigrinus ALCF2SS1-6]
MTESSSQNYGFLGKKAEARYPRLAAEASTWILGPMPPYDFLQKFLGYDTDKVPSTGQLPSKDAFESVPSHAKRESDIYEKLAVALNGRCPGFSFHITANHADATGPGEKLGSTKPDICCYAQQHIDASNVPLSKDGKGRVSHMGCVAFYFEIKASPSQDFFEDPKPGTTVQQRDSHKFIRDGDKRAEDFGQAVNYAVETCKRQHRHCCYSISMSGSSTRFIRWDRAGAVVTEAFDIRTQPTHLCAFLWCFAHASDAERGYDLTVEPASPAEEILFRNAIAKHIITQLPPWSTAGDHQTELNKHYEPNAVTAIFLPLDPGFDINLRRVLVSRPLATPLSVVGRCTRTYWAYDTFLKRVVLLKDTWRSEPNDPVVDGTAVSSDERLVREGDILLYLRKKNVRNIPTVEYQEDVPSTTIVETVTFEADDEQNVQDDDGVLSDDEDLGDQDLPTIEYGDTQTTQTQRFLSAWWVCNRSSREPYVNERKHYRMLSNIVGASLVELRSTAELLYAAYDVFQALRDAYDLANYLHRDLTPGNIVLFNDPRVGELADAHMVRKGYLIDWDLAAEVKPKHPHRDVPVSATWQFLSAALCINLRLAHGGTLPLRYKFSLEHTIRDDMESMIYVVLYCALLWTPHKLSPEELANTMMFFDAYDTLENVPTGGDPKSMNLRTRRHTDRLTDKWAVPQTGIWVNIMLDYVHPAAKITPPRRFNKSQPKYVEPWLSKFLKKHGAALPRNDRFDHVAHHPEKFSDKAPLASRGRPNQATHASPPMGDVRKGKSPIKRQVDSDVEGQTDSDVEGDAEREGKSPIKRRADTYVEGDAKRARGHDSDSTLRPHTGGRTVMDSDEEWDEERSYSPQLYDYDTASAASGPSTSTLTTSRYSAQGTGRW